MQKNRRGVAGGEKEKKKKKKERKGKRFRMAGDRMEPCMRIRR
jgi:hypothetical protein